MKRLLILVLAGSMTLATGFSQNCFTILVGKNASSDGSVFIAHNEDDLNDHNFVDLHKVPRMRHTAGEKQVFLSNTDSIDEVEETFAYFWITGSKYIEEQYLNEWGVAITSNSSRSNVQNGNGRIDHNLRRIVIERARTAREAVKIAGMVVERYGYASSGRIYSIADPNEAWAFEVTNGKHWIARRVPDDEVAIIPNSYVIKDVDEADTANVLASPDIRSYAVENGLYDPQQDRVFNFRKVYGHKNRNNATWNIARKWVVLNQLAPQQYDFNADFPFSFKPKHKINLQDLIDALGNHYENTRFAIHPSALAGSPHYASRLDVTDTLDVCNLYNDYGCITQLRGWLPPDIGNISWISPRYPCIQPFIPWYYGVNRISAGYEKATYAEALHNFNNKNLDYFELYPDHACWVFDDLANRVDSCYGREIGSIRGWKSGFQKDVFERLAEKERDISLTYKTDTDGALRILTDLSNGFAERALNETKDRLMKMKSHGQ
jgi:dipeptidase